MFGRSGSAWPVAHCMYLCRFEQTTPTQLALLQVLWAHHVSSGKDDVHISNVWLDSFIRHDDPVRALWVVFTQHGLLLTRRSCGRRTKVPNSPRSIHFRWLSLSSYWCAVWLAVLGAVFHCGVCTGRFLRTRDGQPMLQSDLARRRPRCATRCSVEQRSTMCVSVRLRYRRVFREQLN